MLSSNNRIQRHHTEPPSFTLPQTPHQEVSTNTSQELTTLKTPSLKSATHQDSIDRPDFITGIYYGVTGLSLGSASLLFFYLGVTATAYGALGTASWTCVSIALGCAAINYFWKAKNNVFGSLGGKED